MKLQMNVIPFDEGLMPETSALDLFMVANVPLSLIFTSNANTRHKHKSAYFTVQTTSSTRIKIFPFLALDIQL